MIEMIANKVKRGVRPHTTHSACDLRLSVFGGKTIGCCCTGHDCSQEYYPLMLHVPGMGNISALRLTKDGYEYLLIDKHSTVSWLSHSDIKAQLEAQHD